jgi:hypothetical protein
METLNFSIKLEQVNKQGNTTFEATCKQIKVKDINNLSKEVVCFVHDFNALVNKKQSLGVKGLNQLRLKKSQPIKMTFGFEGENITLSYANFGKLLESISKENLTEVLNLDIDFLMNYNNLWS